VLERRGELLDGGHRQVAEHGYAAQELDVGIADAHVGVQPPQRRPGEDDRERCEQPDRHERHAQAKPVDDDRGHQTAGRDPEREDRLEAGEHPREDRLVGEAAEQREAGDVDEGVAHADDAEEHERRGLLGDAADEDQRRADSATPSPNQVASRPRPTSRKAKQRAEHPARSDRCGQHADARSPVPSRSMATATVTRPAAAGERLHEAEPVISASPRSPAMILKPSRTVGPARLPTAARRRRRRLRAAAAALLAPGLATAADRVRRRDNTHCRDAAVSRQPAEVALTSPRGCALGCLSVRRSRRQSWVLSVGGFGALLPSDARQHTASREKRSLATSTASRWRDLVPGATLA
jgi:hypothetical protein